MIHYRIIHKDIKTAIINILSYVQEDKEKHEYDKERHGR